MSSFDRASGKAGSAALQLLLGQLQRRDGWRVSRVTRRAGGHDYESGPSKRMNQLKKGVENKLSRERERVLQQEKVNQRRVPRSAWVMLWWPEGLVTRRVKWRTGGAVRG